MDPMAQVAEYRVRRLLDKLIKCHKQLTNTNVSIFITINVICDMLEHMAKLQPFVDNNLDQHGIAAAAVTHAQSTVDAVLHRLGISNPQYASRSTIFRNANQVRSQLISQVIDCVKNARLSESQKKQIKGHLKAQLDGTNGSALSARHLPLVRGLLTGKSPAEVVENIQPAEERMRLSELFRDIDYEHLCRVFAPLTEWKSLRGTKDLHRQINVISNSRRNPFDGDGSRTNQTSTTNRVLLDPGSDSGLHGSRRIFLRDGGSKQSKTDNFTSLVDYRLQLADISDQQRERIMHSLSCCLAHQPFTSQSSAEGILVMGLLNGQNLGMMFEQCETDEDIQGLFKIVRHLHLDGLRVGHDWMFDENGVLVQKAEAAPGDKLAGLDNVAAVRAEALHRHTVASEKQKSLIETCGGEANVVPSGARRDELNMMREAAQQLHRELARAIAEGR